MLNRLVIPTIEGRIFTGITMFVAVMILIGWVAINEPARMASFVEQHSGRSIERGAELFAQACSECHGADGRGILEKAPGLNNPMLFGHSFFITADGQNINNDLIAPLERQIDQFNRDLEALEAERTALTTEAGSADLTEARRQEINTRLAEIDVLTGVEGDTAIPPQIAENQAKLVDLYAQRDDMLATMEGAGGPIERGYFPELEAARAEGGSVLTNYLIKDSSRLAQVGWGGTVENYIKTTLIHGRPGSEKVWPAPMVSWSQRGTGPMRDDQLDDIVSFIMNYNKEDAWTFEDLLLVQQFAKLHGGAAPQSGVPAVGSDVEVAFATVEPLVGDPERGDRLYHGLERTELRQNLGCSGCHAGGASAPATEGTWTRVENDRLTLPQFADFTAEHYIIDSILQPDDYTVPGYASGTMPKNFGEILSAKDLADLVAYLNSTDPNYVAPDPSTITPMTSPDAAAAGVEGAPAPQSAEVGESPLEGVPQNQESNAGENVPNTSGGVSPMATMEATAEATAVEGSSPALPTAAATSTGG